MTDDGFGALMVCAVTQIRLGGDTIGGGRRTENRDHLYVYLHIYIYMGAVQYYCS